jgi:hypothetical protein
VCDMWQEAARPDGNRSPGMNARFGQRTRHSPLSNSVLRLRALPNAVESVCVAAPWASRQRCFCSSVPDKSKKSFRSYLTECAPRASLAGADGAGMMSRQSSMGSLRISSCAFRTESVLSAGPSAASQECGRFRDTGFLVIWSARLSRGLPRPPSNFRGAFSPGMRPATKIKQWD